MAIRSDHIEATERRDLRVFLLVLSPEADIRPAPGHVRGNGDRPWRAGACDDARFHRVVLGVQNLARHAGVTEPRGDAFRLLDRQSADENRPPGGMCPLDLADGRPFLRLPMREDDVRAIDADHRLVCRNDDDVEAVQVSQLRRGRLRGAGHAAQARISLQEMLKRDRPQDASVGLPLESFLRLERRLEAVGPVTVGDDAAGELVHHPDAAVPDDVVDVAPQERVRVERAVDLGQQAVILRVMQAAGAERAFDLFEAGLGQLDVAAVLVGIEMDAGRERRHERGQPRRRRRLAASSTSAKWSGRCTSPCGSIASRSRR